MFLAHYLIPLVIFYFYLDKIVLYGLIIGNLVDLDHIYFRIIGRIDWFSSACSSLGMQCSFGFYPLHNFAFASIFFLTSSLIFIKNKNAKIIGWISLGAFLNLTLDYIHLLTGFGF